MSDLISRQDAIDAFESFIHELGINDEPYNYGEMAFSVQNVPSVEPEKCGDSISREAALEVLDDYAEDIERGNWGTAYSKARASMCELPSVEPERKPGTWEWNKRTGEYECSKCGCNPTYEGMTPDVDEIDKYRFCRWCGARMEVDG